MHKPIQLNQALIYIDEHGNLQDKARLLFIMMGESPPAEAVRPLLDKQNADGGFPSRPRPAQPGGENPSSVDSTLTALWQLNEYGMLAQPPAQRALEYLVATQHPDGSWDENPKLPGHDLPPWIVPGELPTRMYLTAYAAYWLGINGANPHILRRGAAFLTFQQEAGGRLPGYLHGHWIGASALRMAGSHYQEAAAKALAHLAARPWSEWQESQISWALDNLLSAGLEPTHPFVQGGLETLAARQEPEGCWVSEDGPAYAVSATLGALKVLKRAGWIDAV